MSKYGNANLMDTHGFIFTKNKVVKATKYCGEKYYWRCTHNRAQNSRCMAKAVTCGKYVIQWSGNHNHS